MSARARLRTAAVLGEAKLRSAFGRRRGPGVAVLTYHRVAELPRDPHRLAVSPANFRAQLEWLTRHHRVVRFDEDWSRVPRPAVAVTFDDGYADNARVALRLLEECACPATFFVSTGTLGTTALFWWDELAELLLGPGSYPDELVVDDGSVRRRWATSVPTSRLALHAGLHAQLQRAGPVRRVWWLAELRRWRGDIALAPDRDRPMTLEEVAELARSPLVTLGAHGVTHTALARLDASEQWGEIVGSRLELERITGKVPPVFSYPFGGPPDYDRTSRTLCARAGFVRAAANFPGLVHRGSDRYQTPRFVMRDWPAAEFAARLEGFLAS